MHTVDGRRLYGEARETQEEASDDYRRMRTRHSTLPSSIATLQEAIDQVAADQRERGVPESTIKRATHGHANYLLQFWRADTRMTQLDKGELLWFVRKAKELGRSPNTLLAKDLPLLGRCFTAAGLDDPIPNVKAELRGTLKRVPPEMAFFTPEELRSILERMRDGVFRMIGTRCTACPERWQALGCDGHPLPAECPRCGARVMVTSEGRGRVLSIPGRHRDADLVEFLALTGVRSGELGRVMLSDIDDRKGRIRVISKDRGHPRWIEVVGELGPILERLVAAARERTPARTPPEDIALVHDSMNRITNLCRRWKPRLGDERLAGRTLRHTFVVLAHYSGAQPVEVMNLAGHRHLATTDRYTHALTDRRRTVAESVQRTLHGENDESEAPTDRGESHPEQPEPEP